MSGDRLSSGDNKIAISGSNIHIHGGIHQSSEVHQRSHDEFGRVLVEARRTYIKKLPMTVWGSLLTNVAAFLFSALANISGIFSANPTVIPTAWMNLLHAAAMPVMAVSGLFLAVGIYLKLHAASLGISFLGNIERGNDDFLYFSRVNAICPICGGKMRMVGASKHTKDHTLICSRNPSHSNVFDMTSLPDVAEDYKARRDKE